MGIESGLKTQVSLSTDGTTYVNVCLRTAGLDESVDLTDITTFCDAATDLAGLLSASRRRLAELFDSSVTLDGHYDGSTEQKTTLKPGTELYLRFGIDTDGDGTVDVWVANIPMIVESRNRSFNVEEATTISVTVQGNGAVKETETY